MNQVKSKEFFDFIIERQSIWHRRNRMMMGFPWTEDKILQTYKFCNVYRELDKGTIHLIRNVIDKNIPMIDKVFNIILYRRFNVPYFFGVMLNEPVSPMEFDAYEMEKIFDAVKNKGINLFNDAYILCQRTFESNYRKKDKHVQILLAMQRMSKQMNSIKDYILSSEGLEDAWKYIKQEPLIGGFLSYQICIDISYIDGGYWQNDNFVYVGPGAKGGIDYLFGNKKTDRDYAFWCKELFEQQQYFLTGGTWDEVRYNSPYYQSRYLSLSNIQNSLCEFRKYVNLKYGKRCRRRYYKTKEDQNWIIMKEILSQ